ncbi:MAG TPA: metallophosphoesterase [Opitutaceae bacterium]|nr:metallophosphoesterase [Opitutaceae bacterium]
MSALVTRIISDVHYGDPAGLVHDLQRLAPLLDGADRFVINGDALDTQVLENPSEPLGELNALLAAHAPEHVLITGNHDPDISNVHEMLLADERVWVTHGDVFFDEIAPWSKLVPELRRRIQHHTTNISAAEMKRLEVRFGIFRKVCLKLPREHNPHDRGMGPRIMRIAKAVFPPNRFLAMLRVWREMPAIAASVARAQRPTARVIVAGHTHSQGFWQQPDGIIVVNTGCFCVGRTALAVDLVGEQVRIRRIERRLGEFRLGPLVNQFTLAPQRVSALTPAP